MQTKGGPQRYSAVSMEFENESAQAESYGTESRASEATS